MSKASETADNGGLDPEDFDVWGWVTPDQRIALAEKAKEHGVTPVDLMKMVLIAEGVFKSDG